MSDKEQDDEVGLPKATVFKLIQEMLPPDMGCTKEAKEVIVDCCVEWVKMLSTESNTLCEASAKKTISPEHVLDALKQLGFEQFIPEVAESNSEFKQSQKERTRQKPDTQGMSNEQLLALQEQLFANSKNRFEAGQ